MRNIFNKIKQAKDIFTAVVGDKTLDQLKEDLNNAKIITKVVVKETFNGIRDDLSRMANENKEKPETQVIPTSAEKIAETKQEPVKKTKVKKNAKKKPASPKK